MNGENTLHEDISDLSLLLNYQRNMCESRELTQLETMAIWRP